MLHWFAGPMRLTLQPFVLSSIIPNESEWMRCDAMTEEENSLPQVLECANHPGRETSLRCSKCGKPICVQCVIQTPVGGRCRECANLRPLPMYQADLFTVAKAMASGLVASTLSFLVLFLLVRGFTFWLSPLAGIAVGEAISLATNRKRARSLQVVAAGTVVAGALLANVLNLYIAYGRITPALAGRALISDLPALLLFTLLAIVLAISRIR